METQLPRNGFLYLTIADRMLCCYSLDSPAFLLAKAFLIVGRRSVRGS